MTASLRRALLVGPNPAMDIVLEMPEFILGESQRAERSLHLAGGKPMNVARTLRRLGIDVCLVAPLGGRLGPRRLITETCAAMGIDLQVTEIGEETRTCIVIADTATGRSTVVNERGPRVALDEALAYAELTEAVMRPDDLVLVSGSLPPGLPVDFYAVLIERGQAAGTRTIVDTSGEPLRQALEASPWGVKVNGEELRAVTDGLAVEAAALELTERVEHVVVTLGAMGALYAGPEGVFEVPAVSLNLVNATGAGDAFLAGLATGLVRGNSWLESMKLATAASAVVCSRVEPDIGANPALDELVQGVEPRPCEAIPTVDGVEQESGPG